MWLFQRDSFCNLYTLYFAGGAQISFLGLLLEKMSYITYVFYRDGYTTFSPRLVMFFYFKFKEFVRNRYNQQLIYFQNKLTERNVAIIQVSLKDSLPVSFSRLFAIRSSLKFLKHLLWITLLGSFSKILREFKNCARCTITSSFTL